MASAYSASSPRPSSTLRIRSRSPLGRGKLPTCVVKMRSALRFTAPTILHAMSGSGYSDKQRAFLDTNHGAAMITLRADGTPHAVRVGIALVDGKLWSSGVPERVRTRQLRRDPRATLFVFEQGYGYLTVESRVTILDGPDAAEQNLRLFDVMQSARPDKSVLMWQGQPKNPHWFLAARRHQGRLLYEFQPFPLQ